MNNIIFIFKTINLKFYYNILEILIFYTDIIQINQGFQYNYVSYTGMSLLILPFKLLKFSQYWFNFYPPDNYNNFYSST